MKLKQYLEGYLKYSKLKKEERSKVNNLIYHLKILKKKRKLNPNKQKEGNNKGKSRKQ